MKIKIFQYREFIIEGGGLKDNAQMRPCLGRVLYNIPPFEKHRAIRRKGQRCHDFQKGALPTAIRSQNSDGFALSCLEGYSPEDDPAGIRVGQSAHPENQR